MKKEIKGFILGCVAMAAISGSIAIASNATNIEVYPDNVSIYANDKYVNSSNFTYNDTTYVPLRAVLELMDCSIEYDNATKTVYAENNYGNVTSVIPAYLNGNFTPYEMIFDVKNEKFFVECNMLVDGDFTPSKPSGGGLMFMDNDKYVEIDTTQSVTPTAPPISTPKPSKPSYGQDYFYTPNNDDTEEQQRAAYQSELNAINAKYDAMIETVRSSQMGTPSSMSVTIVGQQIQQYEQQRQNEIDLLNAKYGY